MGFPNFDEGRGGESKTKGPTLRGGGRTQGTELKPSDTVCKQGLLEEKTSPRGGKKNEDGGKVGKLYLSAKSAVRE